MRDESALDPDVGRAFFGDFRNLRPAQERAIPPILNGADVLIRAATASGKTEAAIAPLVARFLPMLQRTGSGVIVLIISPTRALINDLHRRLQPPLDSLGITVGVRHGERNQLLHVNPPAVLLTTPESFDIEVGRRPDAFAAIEAIVLDEAHLLYNTQRGMQIGISLERLRLWLKRDAQVIGLSATIGQARDVWQFFRPGRRVEDVDVSGGRKLDLQLRIGVSTEDLVEHLNRFDDKKVLVFANSRRECDGLVDSLLRSSPRCPVYAHHSSLSRDAREETESSFESSTAGICVATSTLELGIDIGSIDVIVVYGVPVGWQSLAQRLGRGNRRSGTVTALLCTSSEHPDRESLTQRLGFQALLLQMSEPEITDERPRQIFGAVGQQLASWLVAEGTYRGINALTAPFSGWPYLDRLQVLSVLDKLVEHEVLIRHPAYCRYGPSEGAYELERVRELWSNFTGVGREMNVSANGTAVGRISARDAARLDTGDCFLLGGRRWEVKSKTMFDLDVRTTNRAPDVQLRYGSARPTADPLRAEAIRRVLCRASDEFCTVMPSSARAQVDGLLDHLRSLGGTNVLPCQHDVQRHIYVTFAGGLLNRAIALWAGETEADVTEFTLTTRKPVPWDRLPETLTELKLPPEMPAQGSMTRFQEWLPESLALQEQQSSHSAACGLDVVIRRLRQAREIPVSTHQLGLIR